MSKNKWIEHIRQFAKDTGSTYGCALSNPKCKETYKKEYTEPLTPVTPIKTKKLSRCELEDIYWKKKIHDENVNFSKATTINNTPRTGAERANDNKLVSAYARKKNSELKRHVNYITNGSSDKVDYSIKPKTNETNTIPFIPPNKIKKSSTIL